jgi:hypothetical protein
VTMFSPSHTPGPWRAGEGDESHLVFMGEEAIADTWLRGDCGDAEANARLIAAAPDLLVACKEALDFVHDMNAANRQARRQILDAIAKAEGDA